MSSMSQRDDAMTYVMFCQIPWIKPTSAWTPNLPSVPTSRATFITSEAKIPNWSIMSLIVFTRCRISPDTGTPVTFCVKSPRATAVCKASLSSSDFPYEPIRTVATAIVRTCTVNLSPPSEKNK